MKVLLDLLFPPNANCLACGEHRIGADSPPLCGGCQDALTLLRLPQNICIRCGHILKGLGCPFCETKVTRHIAWMRAAYAYHGPARSLIVLFKHSSVDAAGDLLVPAMAESFLTDPPEYPIDLCTFVPMPKKRLKFQGADHAAILCDAVSRALSLAAEPLLAATPSKHRQAELSRQERLKNRKGVYTALRDVQGLHILLIDDVLTTGATAAECARILLKGGAASVSLLAAAFA